MSDFGMYLHFFVSEYFTLKNLFRRILNDPNNREQDNVRYIMCHVIGPQ